MMQQYITPLLDAYIRGYDKRYGGMNDAPERKDHYFKAKEDLPRVQAVLGFLHGVIPAGLCLSLLDVGSGRGAFLFPLLRDFPSLEVTSIDILPHRIELLKCLHDGGFNNLHPILGDICKSFPPHAIDRDDARMRLHRMAANSLLAPLFSIRMLCMLCKADMLGRKCGDQQQMLDQIALCEELAREEGCLDGCFAFPSLHTQRAFLSGRDVWKEQELYDDTWGEVVVIAGLPATGKDTWIRNSLPGMPVNSLDDIRRSLKVSPTDSQGAVANIAREQAKDYLHGHQPYVWNATNITAQTRESLVSLFETYHAHVRIVYLETDWNTLLNRNSSREEMVPTQATDRMLEKLSPPEAYEARQVAWLYT